MFFASRFTGAVFGIEETLDGGMILSCSGAGYCVAASGGATAAAAVPSAK